MTQDRVLATYFIETPYPLEYAAEVVAGEQSTGTFVKVPGETDTLHQRFGARVESIEELEEVDRPSLPGVRMAGSEPVKFRRGKVVLSFPLENFGLSIPNLLSTVAGNLYELGQLSGIKLLDLDLPSVFASKYPGPQFGIEGTRSLTGVYGRPLIGTIIKPNVGVTPEELRPVVRALARAGVDFIKDDELLGNPPYCPLKDRVRAVMEEINRVADETGKQVMYAFNITDDVDQLVRHHDVVVGAGGTCVMVSINSVGLAGVAYLRQYSQVPIHGHRNGWGALGRYPALGMGFKAYQKLCRLAGVDHLHTNGLFNKFSESNAEVVDAIRACLEPMFDGFRVMPVLSSGQWAAHAPVTYEAVGSTDLIHLAGGGIHAHPGGPAAGVKSMHQAWEAALMGADLDTYARAHAELRQALDKFGVLALDSTPGKGARE